MGAGAAVRARDVAQAVSLALGAQAEQLQQQRKAGLLFSERHRGAARRQAEVVASCLSLQLPNSGAKA